VNVLAHVDTAVIVAKPHTGGCANGERSELLRYGLPDTLQRFWAFFTAVKRRSTPAF
jgi:hypothetical protein